jgi:hypothetical protein
VRPEVLILGPVAVRCGGQLRPPSSGPARSVLGVPAEAVPAAVPEAGLPDVVRGEHVGQSTPTVAVHRPQPGLASPR